MFAQVSRKAGRPNFQAGHAGSIPVIRSHGLLAGQGIYSSVRGLRFRTANRFRAIIGAADAALARLAALARGEQEFGYKVEIIEGEVNAASVVNPPQRPTAASDQPQVGMQCDVCGSRGIAAAQLGKRSGSCSLVEDEAAELLGVP